MKELGSCQAIINKMSTTVDGGIRLTIDLNPESSELIKSLIDLAMSEEPNVLVAFVKE